MRAHLEKLRIQIAKGLLGNNLVNFLYCPCWELCVVPFAYIHADTGKACKRGVFHIRILGSSGNLQVAFLSSMRKLTQSFPNRALVLLRHKRRRFVCRVQQGQRESFQAMATINLRRIVAIEFGM